MNFESITMLFGGLAIFIYGMNRMAEGLQKVTGDKLKKAFGILVFFSGFNKLTQEFP